MHKPLYWCERKINLLEDIRPTYVRMNYIQEGMHVAWMLQKKYYLKFTGNVSDVVHIFIVAVDKMTRQLD